MLLSVIVPVYNAGEYLKPCIESLLALPLEMEILIVDDGSTDGAVDRLAISDTRLTVVRQTNQGVSAARNAGLKLAKGEWVWFVDADDRTLPDLNPNYNLNQKWSEVYETLLVLPFIWEENGEAKQYGAKDGEIPYNLWRCWFRRELIEKNGVRFAVGRKYAEDQEFILQYLIHLDVINSMALDGPVYHYTMRASGAMMRSDVQWKKRWDLWCVLGRFTFQALLTGKIKHRWVRQQIKRLTKNLIII